MIIIPVQQEEQTLVCPETTSQTHVHMVAYLLFQELTQTHLFLRTAALKVIYAQVHLSTYVTICHCSFVNGRLLLSFIILMRKTMMITTMTISCWVHF